jgi:hypothetical protein
MNKNKTQRDELPKTESKNKTKKNIKKLDKL